MTFKPPFLTLPKLTPPTPLQAKPRRKKGASMYAISSNSRHNAITLPGSLKLMPVPSRDSINTEARSDADKTRAISGKL